MSCNIGPRFAFYGYIPDGSDKQHIGIVLNAKEELIKYCYCTSKYTKIYADTDFISIPKDKMTVYFKEPRDTYIYLSQRHIIDIFFITFVSRLETNEYDVREEIDTDIYIAILTKLRNSDNLSDRFKNEIITFLE